jgi:hypothetical protein
MAIPVNVENFVRAESDRMFAALHADAGGVNRLKHNREPTPIEHQPVIRMNRDTLYSSAVVDISEGAAVTIPDCGDRYVSVTVVNHGRLELHRPPLPTQARGARRLLDVPADRAGLTDRPGAWARS